MEILYSSTWNSISKIKSIILRPNWTTCSMSLKMVFSKSISYLTYFSEANISIRWSRFLVVITTHSDPNTGDLHIAPDCAFRGLFDKVLCFSQPNFQPSYMHKFVMDFATNYFIMDWINSVHVLWEQQTLGHTQILSYSNHRLSPHSDGPIQVHAQWVTLLQPQSSAHSVVVSDPHLQSQRKQIQVYFSAQSADGTRPTSFLRDFHGAMEKTQQWLGEGSLDKESWEDCGWRIWYVWWQDGGILVSWYHTTHTKLFNQLPCILPFLLFVGHISHPVSHYAYITIIFKPQIV